MPIDFVALNKGPVLVIDDTIGGEEDDIKEIISRIEKKGLPVLKYNNLDKANEEINNLYFSNFIILDWYLFPEELPGDVSLGATLRESLNKKKIDFIKKVKHICFSPIFIFTNISTEGIEEEIEKPLMENSLLYSDSRRNFIFIRNKQEILKNLFEDINKWILKNPHIYFSKIWLNQCLKNSNEIFWSLYKKNSNWPNVFYKSFVEDGEDPIYGLNDILFRLVKAKMSYRNLDTKIIGEKVDAADMNEIKLLYAGIMYLEEKDKIEDDIKPGDIFKEESEYYINIRPECDTTKKKDKNIDKIDIYLVKGKQISNEWVEENLYDEKYGLLNRPTLYILPFLDGKNFVQFQFKNLEIREYSEMKSKKICRLLPPFITSFQHQFSGFLGRYGMPRVPDEVFAEIFGNNNDRKKDTEHKKK